MHRSLALCLAVTVTLGFVPLASAASPSCEDVTDEDTYDGAVVYLRGAESDTVVEVWEEANGVDGLQTEACVDADGEEVSADAQVESVPAQDLPWPWPDPPRCFLTGNSYTCLPERGPTDPDDPTGECQQVDRITICY
ncbi:hypothetical protein BRD56_12265 [Thermoplasmatales archaeon SW_10_69_26]|nr:MAG: hypothetical protein BRD56_12265 [Thermoplasmatales archaeon SW_10_69_26]